ncbi:MAG: hypothetical protein FJ088_04040 [Deltaproteobacteria bacterium]|nr:hypothetical protein [Deltaproteobacteria bacterium]
MSISRTENKIKELLFSKFKRDPSGFKKFSPALFHILEEMERKEKKGFVVNRSSAAWFVNEVSLNTAKEEIALFAREIKEKEDKNKARKMISNLMKLEKFKTSQWYHDALALALVNLGIDIKKATKTMKKIFLKEKPERIFVLSRGITVGARIPWIPVFIEFDPSAFSETEELKSIIGFISDERDVSQRHDQMVWS